MPTILEAIKEPSDLRKLSAQELTILSREIRQTLIETVTNNGGHLASNLGVVELTIALHRFFSSPTDKVLWDVGHQSYVHKLLTGRQDYFSMLRRADGLSGFSEPMESPHDAFISGHASTSISAAVGMAIARDLAGEKFEVIAVIGDGSMGGGMAFEALNHIGHLKKRIIVVLNDNGMAISPSVGAQARWLNRIRLSHRYHMAKGGTEQILLRTPGGRFILRNLIKAKTGLKRVFLPTTLWEQMGFKYIGPVDGHNLKELEESFDKAQHYTAEPVLIHVMTVKGKGYAPAEKDAVGFHGLSPNGESKRKAPNYSDVFGNTLMELFHADKKLVAISAAMLDGTGLKKLAETYPDRVFDVGICEQHAVTMAAAMASRGLIPVVAIYSTFLQRAFDQVIHDVCIPNLPVVFALDRAGIVGEDGKTHQGTLDLSYLRLIPNMTVSAPKDENELRHLLFTAVRAGRPFAIRYPRGQGCGVEMDKDLHRIPVGQWELLREGDHLAVFALGSAVMPSLEAAKKLEEEGIRCAVVNARFAKPLDIPLLEETLKVTRKVVAVEENVVAGGLSDALARFLAGRAYGEIKYQAITLPDEFIPQGPVGLLRSRYGLDSSGLKKKIRDFFYRFEEVSGAAVKTGRFSR